MDDNLVRIGHVLRQADLEWLNRQAIRVSTQSGVRIGRSIVIRMLIDYAIKHGIELDGKLALTARRSESHE